MPRAAPVCENGDRACVRARTARARASVENGLTVRPSRHFAVGLVLFVRSLCTGRGGEVLCRYCEVESENARRSRPACPEMKTRTIRRKRVDLLKLNRGHRRMPISNRRLGLLCPAPCADPLVGSGEDVAILRNHLLEPDGTSAPGSPHLLERNGRGNSCHLESEGRRSLKWQPPRHHVQPPRSGSRSSWIGPGGHNARLAPWLDCSSC